MGTNYKIERLYNDLNTKSIDLADALDLSTLSSFQKQYQLSQLKQIVREIRALQTSSNYDGTKLLRLPNGSSAPANAAIYGAMMFVQEIENELNKDKSIRTVPTTSIPNRPPSKQDSRDIGDELLGYGAGLVGAALFVMAVISFFNGSTGVIDATLGVVLGIILLGVAGFCLMVCYGIFNDKNR